MRAFSTSTTQLLFMFLFMMPCVHAEQKQLLSVGQVERFSSLPDEIVLPLKPSVEVVPASATRSEVYPSTTPLPTALTDLPDVVSGLVGFQNN